MRESYLDGNYQELKLILDLSFDLITISNGSGIFTAASKSCEQYFGVSEQEIVGMGPSDLVASGVFDRSVTAQVISQREQVTMVQKTASGKTLLVKAHPIFSPEGELLKIISFSKDITEEQILSGEVEKLNGELNWYKKELQKRQAIDKSNVILQSRSMSKVVELIQHVANSHVTVLLLGETGVGKSYFARLIHESSTRKDAPFVTINCGAIPKELLESELFGFEDGAFTGARKGGKKGLFEIAGKGTIFLDEIGDIPLALQVKLLHVLDQKQVLRIGGTVPVRVDARIIAATNKDLYTQVQAGAFREDLYYRLNVLPITIPPLRKRREDIPHLANLFLQRYNKEYDTCKIITESGYSALSQLNYAGNVRELEHIVERLIITSTRDVIDASQVKLLELLTPDPAGPEPAPRLEQVASLKEEVEKLERRLIVDALNRYRTTRKAAEALKVDQSTVVKKMKRLNIKAVYDQNPG